MAGINLTSHESPASDPLKEWYKGPTLVDLLGTRNFAWCLIDIHILFKDVLEPPTRDIASPLRFPISNVFREQSGLAISGRVCGGVVQTGERLRIIPGDEYATVKCELYIRCLKFETEESLD